LIGFYDAICSSSPEFATIDRYDVQKAEAHQASLATELQQHFIPLIQQELNVDVLCDKLEACMKSAAQNTMPQACKRGGVHSCKHQPWFNSSCREALDLKDAVYKNPHSTAAEKIVAEKKFRSVTDRVKETWTRKRNAELCELSAKDPSSSGSLLRHLKAMRAQSS